MSGLPLIAAHAPDAPFCIHGGRRLRAGEFVAAALALAARLPDRGTVLLLCEDRAAFAVGFAGALLRRSTALLPSSRAPLAIERIVQSRLPACALVDSAAGASSLPEIVVDPWGAQPLLHEVPAIEGDHVAAIVHTSGTTGDPQPHAKTWSSLVRGADALRERVGFRIGSAIVGAVPPQHMWGLEATIMLAMQGGGIVHAGMPLLPADIAAALGDVAGARWLVATPLHIRACVQSGIALPSLQGALTATSALDRELAARFEAMTGAPLIEIYGATETGVVGTRCPAHDVAFTPLRGVHVACRAEGVAFGGGHLDDDVVVRDHASVDPAGMFTLAGRDSDLVKVGGKRASLAALNRELLAIEGVVDGTFVADEPTSQRLAALVVAPALDAASIRDALRDRIDAVFLPRPLHRVDALPRDALGKLTHQKLHELLRALSAPTRRGPRAHVSEVVVPREHPALPGHFPGRPIVPAAWIMTLVVAACRDAWRCPAPSIRIQRARFRAPLRPGASLRIALERNDDGTIVFGCTHEGTRIADGTIVVAESRL